jgi:flagellar hook-associated protein FlgK
VGSLTSLFDVARSALASDQLALSVTSNNVANQNTVGYTRQVVSFSSLDSVTLSNSGGTGSSATVTASESSKRDRVLEQRVQQQTQTQASRMYSVSRQVQIPLARPPSVLRWTRSTARSAVWPRIRPIPPRVRRC